jgi:glycosyltransferase involved in cell wall biosynthesis
VQTNRVRQDTAQPSHRAAREPLAHRIREPLGMDVSGMVPLLAAAPEQSTARPMRVVHIVPSLFSREAGVLGGAERYAFELARAMSKCVETCLISFGPDRKSYREDLLEVRVFPPWYVRNQKSNPVSFSAIAETTRADVVHVHQRHVLIASLTALVGKIKRTPVFVTDLGGGGWDFSSYVNTDGLFTGHLHISEYSRRVAGHGGLSTARVILGGVDAKKFQPGPGGHGVLFVGRLLPHKGVDVLLRALPEGLPLRIVGTSLSTPYRQLLGRLSQGKRVEFMEAVSDHQLMRLYREADVIVLPSVYQDCYGGVTRVPELLGQTLLEGMAAGLPAICTNVASMPEVVLDEVTGFVVPPNDPPAIERTLRRLVGQPELRSALGQAGRRRVETVFSWEQTVNRCLEAYEGKS